MRRSCRANAYSGVIEELDGVGAFGGIDRRPTCLCSCFTLD